MVRPKRGEVWWVDLEPTKSAELTKIRPVVVLNTEDAGVLPIKLVAPITAWSDRKLNNVWLVPVRPTKQNGLTKDSCVDTMQVRGLSTTRFSRRAGVLSADDLNEVITALALVVGYEG